MKPIELTVPFVRTNAAITLWPMILYGRFSQSDPCTRAHERHHWGQALHFGVVPWYALYVVLALRWGFGRRHPLERAAWTISDKCRGIEGEK